MSAGTAPHGALSRSVPLVLLVVLAIIGLVACTQGSARTGPITEGCYEGVLTDEGGRCQSLRRDADGGLVTFHADMNGWRLGQRACVCGSRPLLTSCPRDSAIEVTWLAPFCPPSSP